MFAIFFLIAMPDLHSKSRKHAVMVTASSVIVATQIAAIMPYLMSGIWKARKGIECLYAVGFSCVLDALPNSISRAYVIAQTPLDPVAEYFISQNLVSGLFISLDPSVYLYSD